MTWAGPNRHTNIFNSCIKAIPWYLSITNSDLNRPCFLWRPYGKSGLFKTELVIDIAFIHVDIRVKENNGH